MARKIVFIFFVILISASSSFAQIGGRYTYAFLELPYSARTSALGHNMIPIYDKDLTLAISNPALLNADMDGRFNLTYSNYLADVNFGNVSYAKSYNNGYIGLTSLRYINYGDFIQADEFGNKIGHFSAGEYAMNLAAAKVLNENWTAGGGLKFIYSTFEQYTSFGLATDYAVAYHSVDKLFASSLSVTNLGFQIKPYSSGNREPLPLNVQIGVSKKLEHMPLRFIMVAHHLNKLDFSYVDPNQQIILSFDETEQQALQTTFSDKVFRHFVFAGEFVFSENFHIRVGYNHQRRKELQIADRPGMAGYSWGFGLRVKKLYLSYGNTIYHLAGGSHMFSLTISPSEFIKKKTVNDNLK